MIGGGGRTAPAAFSGGGGGTLTLLNAELICGAGGIKLFEESSLCKSEEN